MLWWSMACLALSGTASGSATEFGGMILGREEEFVPLLQSLRGREGIRWIRGQSPRAGELGYQSLGDVRPLVLSATDGPLDGLPGDLLTVRNVVRDGVAARPDTRTWEVWNEPDFHFVRDSAADMAAVLKAAWWGIKAARPDDHVIMPSLAFRPSRYAMELMHNGAASWTDGYNVHFYGWPSDYARVLAQHRVLDSAAGLVVRFWVTDLV